MLGLDNPKRPCNKMDVVDMFNPKIPKNKGLFGEILKTSLAEVIQRVQSKLNEVFLDQKIRKNLDFLQNCLGILLDLGKQMKESGSLVMRFEEYKSAMGFSNASSMFSSEDI